MRPISETLSSFNFFSLRFPTDPNSQTIDRQLLWGSSLLISPVLEQGAEEIAAYLPSGTWYSLHNVSHSTKAKAQPFLSASRQTTLCLRLSEVNHD